MRADKIRVAGILQSACAWRNQRVQSCKKERSATVENVLDFGKVAEQRSCSNNAIIPQESRGSSLRNVSAQLHKSEAGRDRQTGCKQEGVEASNLQTPARCTEI